MPRPLLILSISGGGHSGISEDELFSKVPRPLPIILRSGGEESASNSDLHVAPIKDNAFVFVVRAGRDMIQVNLNPGRQTRPTNDYIVQYTYITNIYIQILTNTRLFLQLLVYTLSLLANVMDRLRAA